jgi:hypothetical protein
MLAIIPIARQNAVLHGVDSTTSYYNVLLHTRYHAYKLLPHYNRLDLRKYFFLLKELYRRCHGTTFLLKANFSTVKVFKRFAIASYSSFFKILKVAT